MISKLKTKQTILYVILIILVITIGVLGGRLYKYQDYSQELLNLLFKADTSIHYNTECKTSENIWLVTYGNKDTYFANERALVSSGLNKCIDFYKPYTKKHLDAEFVKKNQTILEQSRGGGYWLWKPYLILKTLNEIPENDYIIYLDSSIKMLKNITPLVEKLKDADILLFRNNHSNRKYVKRDLLKIMDMDKDEVRDSTQLQGGFLVIRNTQFSRDFIKKWLELCENPQAVTDAPSVDEYKDFVDHRHDQAILTLLYLKDSHNILTLPPEVVDEYFFVHRRASIHTRSLMFDQQELTLKEKLVNRKLLNLQPTK
jgi:hypothetical protein